MFLPPSCWQLPLPDLVFFFTDPFQASQQSSVRSFLLLGDFFQDRPLYQELYQSRWERGQ